MSVSKNYIFAFVLFCIYTCCELSYENGENQIKIYNCSLQNTFARASMDFLEWHSTKNETFENNQTNGIYPEFHNISLPVRFIDVRQNYFQHNRPKRDSVLEVDSLNNTVKNKGFHNSSNVELADINGQSDDSVPPCDEGSRENGYNVSSPRESPYSVLLQTYAGVILLGECTGSLLTAEWVLSAAHCIASEIQITKVTVYAGGHSSKELLYGNTAEGSQTLNSFEFYSHPKYDDTVNDICLIKTKEKFKLTDTVNTIKLSTEPWTYHSYVDCKITGFGIVQRSGMMYDDDVRKTHILSVKKPCLCSFRMRALGVKQLERWICTKPKEDFGVCSGDSGGGLVCDGKVKAVTNILIDVIENPKTCELSKFLSSDCGSRNIFNVFLDVCPYVKWVNSYIKLFNDSDISPHCTET